MSIDALQLIYFSPTHTSRKIVEAIAAGVQAQRCNRIDLTLADASLKVFPTLGDDLAIIGMPVYAGRLPEEAVARMRRIRGNNTPAVVVVLYGNRAYDDALIELRDLAVEQGFVPIAAGAFIGEHSFSDENALIAHQRPDAEDLSLAIAFGQDISAKLESQAALQPVQAVQVPGNVPYMDYRVLKNVAPISDRLSCTLCGTCATVCPTGAITLQDNAMITDASLCILCCACVKSCTTGGRELVDERIAKTRWMLVSKFSERKAPEIYFAS